MLHTVTLTPAVQIRAAELDLPHSWVRAARIRPERIEHDAHALIVIGQLADGRRARLTCPPDHPMHITALDLVTPLALAALPDVAGPHAQLGLWSEES